MMNQTTTLEEDLAEFESTMTTASDQMNDEFFQALSESEEGLQEEVNLIFADQDQEDIALLLEDISHVQ